MTIPHFPLPYCPYLTPLIDGAYVHVLILHLLAWVDLVDPARKMWTYWCMWCKNKRGQINKKWTTSIRYMVGKWTFTILQVRTTQHVLKGERWKVNTMPYQVKIYYIVKSMHWLTNKCLTYVHCLKIWN